MKEKKKKEEQTKSIWLEYNTNSCQLFKLVSNGIICIDQIKIDDNVKK